MSVSAMDDSELGIAWSMPGQAPLLSAKDLAGAPLADAEVYP